MTTAGFEEKDFYLDEFRGHALCFAVPLADCERRGDTERLGEVVRELIANDTRVIVLLGVAPTGADMDRVVAFRRRLQRHVLRDGNVSSFAAERGRPSLATSFLGLGVPGGDSVERDVAELWSVLRTRPLVVQEVAEEALVEFAQGLAIRLRLDKLVIIEAAGGVSMPRGGQLSFMDEPTLAAALHEGEAEWTGLAGRRKTLRAIQSALRGGVRAVNLCTLEGVARELFTYEGSGTLFTAEDYCRVERLGIDDFEPVERLLERGHREGFLKPRGAAETTRILLNGYGATIGAHHLAGVCALETDSYRDERAGEIVGLYTMTRFKGEGVGARLVERVLADAAAMGLRYVFASAVDARAQMFFERLGFRGVTHAEVPAAKWVDYDARRLTRVRVFRKDLAPTTAADQ